MPSFLFPIVIEWLECSGKNPEFETLPVQDLNDMLRKFYAEMRSQDGKRYGRASLSGIRAAVNRHLNSPQFHRNINVMQDREFNSSNNLYKAMLKQLKSSGLDRVEHKMPICNADLQKIATSGVLSTTTPTSLLRKVWFDLLTRFVLMGL